MRLDIKAATLAGAILWGGMFLLVGLINLAAPPYGAAWLDLGSSIYPGYAGPGGFGSVIVVTLYAVLDGAVAGAVIAWVYNRFVPAKAHAAPM